jgi:ribosomal protein L11 methyltransferase
MINSQSPLSIRNQSSPCPYDDLYIYQIEGRPRSPLDIRLNCYIGNWEEGNSSFLFFSEPAYPEVEKLLQAQPQLTCIDIYHMSYEQWQGTRFHSFDQGCFRIIAPWQDAAILKDGQLPIFLDPGVVFGTGSHPTTQDCLEAVELACRQKPPERVLDLGTGSGLLALAAARLGCKLNLAVDVNLLAAQTAAKNVRLNRLKNQIAVVQGDAEDFIECPADMLIANIHFSVMQKLIKANGFQTKQRFILSGLLCSEAKQIQIDLEHASAKIIKSWTREGIWHTFYGEIRN